MEPLYIQDDIVIPEHELEVTTSRSSGPGGQHVNKVESRVTVRFLMSMNESLPVDVRERLAERAAHLVTADGDIIVSSQRHRSQRRNLEDCLERLRGLIVQSLRPPVPRKPTRPTRASLARRRQEKARRSRRKEERRPVDPDAD